MILWGQPLWLLGLIVPLLLAALELPLAGRDKRARRRFASAKLFDELTPERSIGLKRTKRWVLIAALAFLAVGLANPRIGTRYEEVTREGIDIILAVDVSRSMDSQDIRPSRLAKTRYELARFLEGMKGDRVGIVPFAGQAYPLLPMTLDYGAARLFLDLLATDLIPASGTDIAAAIQTSLAMFPQQDGEKRGRAIVLVSDGEDHEGGAVDAAKEAAKQDVRIYTVGMALAKGDPIPVYDEQGNRTGWLNDDEGQIVTSRLNESVLEEIAAATDGEYVRATQGDDAFRKVYRELFQLDRSEFDSKRITGYEDRFQPLLIVALALLVLQMLLPDGRRHHLKNAAVGALLLTLILPATSQAQKAHSLVKEGNRQVIEKEYDKALAKYLEAKSELDTTRPELTYDLAGVYARKGEAQLADSLYQSLPEDAREELLARAAYNRGTMHAQQQDYKAAVDNLIDALVRNPKDMDAKRNLELALRRQQQQQQQQQQGGQQKQQQKQQQDQQQQQQQQQDQQEKQDEQQQQEEQEQQQQPEPTPEEKMDKEMAKRLLDQLEQDEKELLKDVVRKQMPQQQSKTKKPW